MEKDPKDPKDSGKDNPEGNPKGNLDPNVQALQKKLTEKDKEMKRLQEEMESLKKKPEISEDKQRIDELSKNVEELTRDNQSIKLQEKYPDILPEILFGKTEAEQELIVKKMRDKIEENYSKKPSDHEPVYTNRSDFDKAVESVKEDKTIDTDTKLAKIRELKLKRNF